VLAAVHMGFVEYCAARITAARMADDVGGRTLVVHNGDISYAECAPAGACAAGMVAPCPMPHSTRECATLLGDQESLSLTA